jgi:hypothetical protein
VFTIERGFRAALQFDGFLGPLLARLDGTRSVARAFGQAERAGETPPGYSREAFVTFVAMMVERGFLEIDARDG